MLLQYLAEATVGHDAKRFEEKEVSVKPVDTFGEHIPEMKSIFPFDNLHSIQNPLFPNVKLIYDSIKEMDSLLKLPV